MTRRRRPRTAQERVLGMIGPVAPGSLGGRVRNTRPAAVQHKNTVNAIVRDIPFSFAGTLIVSTSPPYTPPITEKLTDIRALLGTAGTSDTVVTVYKNGSSIGTVTLAAGQVNESTAFSVAFVADTDLLTVGVTTAGADAEDITVHARFA